MSKLLMTRAIESLAHSGLILRAKDPAYRISEEEVGLKRLRYKDDFLSSYNEALRYMFILSLREGFDIKHDRVHPALRTFLRDCLCIEDEKVSGLVSARHSMKYDGSPPKMAMRMLLSRVRDELSALCD